MTLAEIQGRFQRQEPWLAACVAAALAALAFLDCVVYQLLRGNADLPLAGLWLAVSVPPWLLSWLALRLRPAAGSRSADVGNIAAITAAAAILAALADMAAFPSGNGSGIAAFLQHFRAELPIGLALFVATVLQGRAPTAQTAEPDPRLEMLLGCDVCRAAGNYVEAVRGGRARLVRLSLSEAESFLGRHGYVRVHRSALVASHAIVGFENDRSGLVAIRTRNGERVKVGRLYRPNLYPLRDLAA